MKNRISIGVLFLFCAQCAHSAVDGPDGGFNRPAKHQVDVTGQNGVDVFNNLRKRVAYQYNIANMQETVYDKEYEKLLTQSTCDNPPKGDFVLIVKAERELGFVETVLKEKRPVLDPEIDKYKDVFNPKRTRFACSRPATPCENDFPNSCLVGPGSTSSDRDFIRGPPGSKCPNGKASSGLCASPSANGGSAIGGYFSALTLIVLAILNSV